MTMSPAKHILAGAAVSAALIASAAVAQPGVTKFTSVLTGAAEVPGPGDPDGRGEATINVNSVKGKICWEINVRDIETATAAHIHEGAAGVAGPPVLGLSAPVTNNDSTGCEDVPLALAEAIRSAPSNYYVNVHNAPYPDGALRGQLG